MLDSWRASWEFLALPMVEQRCGRTRRTGEPQRAGLSRSEGGGREPRECEATGATSAQVPQVTPRGCAPGTFTWLLSQTAWPPWVGWGVDNCPPTHTHWSSWQGRAWPGQRGAFSAPAGPQPSPHLGTHGKRPELSNCPLRVPQVAGVAETT